MSNQRTVLITGCSEGGIGHALAEEFHARGLRVIPTARRLESMARLAALGMQPLQLDVTDTESVRRVRDEVSTVTGGKLDILVNNAGQGLSKAATDLDFDAVQALFEVNVFGVMRMVKEFTRLLIASGDGLIVQIGSLAAITPIPFASAYNASKGALHSYSNTLRVELAPFNVKVVVVATGKVKSNISRPASLPEDSLYHPMEHDFLSKVVGSSQRGATDTQAYAQFVVSKVLAPKPPVWVWAGSLSWLVWFMDTFLPKNAFDGNMAKGVGLDTFAKRIRSGEVTIS